MKINYLYSIICACLLLLSSCNVSKKDNLSKNVSKKDSFPSVKNLKEYPQTDFLPTLEHSLPVGKNGIYAASLLYAWDEIRNVLKKNIAIEAKYSDLSLLHASKSYLNVLKKDEYSASVKIEGDRISASAYFQKILPFTYKFDAFPDKLTFLKEKIRAFGVDKSEIELYHFFSLLYYENDDNFILKIRPKDDAHEILLCKFGESKANISAYLQKIQAWKVLGDTMRKDHNKQWRFEVLYMDKVVIPTFKFNIETDYGKLLGNRFKAGEVFYTITKANQRTAFVFDESGAKVESDAKAEADKKAVEAKPIEKPHPKNLVFDKPFLLLMKRTDSENPYFAMWVNNTELMEKSK